MIKVPRLKVNRYGVFCLRVYWRDEQGKLRESLHSLGTKRAATAPIMALQFNLAHEQKRAMTDKTNLPNLDDLIHKYKLDIANGVMQASDPSDHALMMEAIKAFKEIHGVLPPLQAAMQMGKGYASPEAENRSNRLLSPRVLAKSKLLSEATAEYLDEKRFDNVAQTLLAKKRTYADFVNLFGDLEINLISKAEVVQWKTQDLKRDITANRINQRLGQLNDFFNWAIKHGHYTAYPTSPCEGLFISGRSKVAAQTEHYEPFSNDELKTIFGTGYLKKFSKPDFYWLPVIALFTGARREEIATLEAKDIKTVDGVPCMHIQRGKTPDARRVVPLHPQLLAMGLMDYAQHVQSLGEPFLFPYLVESVNGKGKNAGRQFSNWLEQIGITDKHKVFHSFRHTLITRLHALASNPAHVMQITGHTQEAQGIHFGTYTHDVGLQALAETLGKLSYPLDFQSLKLVDPTFKPFLKRWKMIEDRKARFSKKRA